MYRTYGLECFAHLVLNLFYNSESLYHMGLYTYHTYGLECSGLVFENRFPQVTEYLRNPFTVYTSANIRYPLYSRMFCLYEISYGSDALSLRLFETDTVF